LSNLKVATLVRRVRNLRPVRGPRREGIIRAAVVREIVLPRTIGLDRVDISCISADFGITCDKESRDARARPGSHVWGNRQQRLIAYCAAHGDLHAVIAGSEVGHHEAGEPAASQAGFDLRLACEGKGVERLATQFD
jgi:hypothetical protein